MTTLLERPGTFGEQHFGDCQLGDRRRQRRLVRLADALLAHPEGSLPQKLQDPADYRALCRLANHPQVTPAAVLRPHCRKALAEARAHPGVVLLIHDTTELDFSGHTTLALGQIGNGHGQGYECHNSLAADPVSGHLFGLVHQILHRRRRVPADEGVAAKRACPRRESRLWLEAVQAIGPAPERALWVDICDRGADTFEFLEHELRQGRHFVIRSTHNRALEVEADDGGPRLLHDRLRRLAPLRCWTVAIGGRAGQPARQAKLQAACQPVRLRPPHVRRGLHRREALALWAIRVWEVDAPAEVREPVEWLLLTDLPIPEGTALRERVGWYERRPLVEEFHKGQKTGVGIEGLRFQSRAGLEPVIALLSVVAVALVNLRGAARQAETAERPAAEVVDPLWVRVLSVWRYQQERALTVREFMLALGRLGGHLNRTGDGLPGWQTLWKGWNQLHAMISYELSRQRCGKL
jgi:hypothetical protein